MILRISDLPYFGEKFTLEKQFFMQILMKKNLFLYPTGPKVRPTRPREQNSTFNIKAIIIVWFSQFTMYYVYY